MELTREQAIMEHRKMWKWISRQIMKDYKENYSIKDINSYKKIYLDNNFKNEYIACSCFCCQYATNKNRIQACVNNCPLYWNAENTEENCMKGYYSSVNRILHKAIIGFVTVGSVDEYIVCEEGAKKLSRMAYKIAMLEERKDNV